MRQLDPESTTNFEMGGIFYFDDPSDGFLAELSAEKRHEGIWSS